MSRQEEVGDLFVAEGQILLRLLPSRRSAAKRIRWFARGIVTDHDTAAQDIARLVERLKGKGSSGAVRGLTLMTSRGADFNTSRSGLRKAVAKAGFRILN